MYTAESIKDRVQPLTLRDWVVIQKWMKQQPVEEAKLYSAGLPMAEQSLAIREATSRASRCYVTTPEGFEILSSFAGVIKLVHETLKKTEPTLTEQAVADGIIFPDLKDLLDLILEKNGFLKNETPAIAPPVT